MSWRPRFRFRLLTLFIAVTAIAVWLGLIVDRAYRQKRGVAHMEKLSGAVFFDYQRPPNAPVGAFGLPAFSFDHTAPPPGPEWAREWLDEEYFRKAVCIRMWDARLNDDDLEMIAGLRDLEAIECYRVDLSATNCQPLARLKKLRKLLLNECVVGETSLAPFARSVNLVHLELTDMDLDDARLPPLSGLKSLLFLRLTGTKITGSGFGDLRRLSRLKAMFLTDIPFSDSGMEAIGTLPAPTNLKLEGTAVTDDGLAHLANLVSLERLELDRTRISDRGLAHLAKLTSLEILTLRDTSIHGNATALEHLHGLLNLRVLNVDVVRDDATDRTLTRLRKALPNCEIYYWQRDATGR